MSRSIGVSNFSEKDLEVLLASARIKPAVNQVCITRYNAFRARISNLVVLDPLTPLCLPPSTSHLGICSQARYCYRGLQRFDVRSRSN